MRFSWIGVALLALLTIDVFFTVFHPNAHGGPINRRQNRLYWRVATGVGCRLSGRWRDRVLSAAGPMLALVTLGVWGLALLLGFALIYYDFTAFLMHSEAPLESRWWSAIYYSGYVGSTLGLGDVTPSEDWLRVVTVIQAFTGFMLVSVAVTYILALYGAEGDAESCATGLATFLGDADEEIGRRARDLDRLDRWAAGQTRRLTGVLTAHSRFPILHYFRPPDRRQSLLVQIGRTLPLIEVVEHETTDLERYPALAAFRATVELYLDGSAEQHGPHRHALADDREPGGRAERRRAQHRQLMDNLCYKET